MDAVQRDAVGRGVRGLGQRLGPEPVRLVHDPRPVERRQDDRPVAPIKTTPRSQSGSSTPITGLIQPPQSGWSLGGVASTWNVARWASSIGEAPWRASSVNCIATGRVMIPSLDSPDDRTRP